MIPGRNTCSGLWAAEKLRVTDCACGTGEITLRLARAGHIMTGVDISGDMLRIASEKARRAALKIPFVEQDMRKLALHRPRRYNLSLRRGELPRFAEGRRGVLRGRKRRAEGGRPAAFRYFVSSTSWKTYWAAIPLRRTSRAGRISGRTTTTRKARLIEVNLTFFERQGEALPPLYRAAPYSGPTAWTSF